MIAGNTIELTTFTSTTEGLVILTNVALVFVSVVLAYLTFRGIQNEEHRHQEVTQAGSDDVIKTLAREVADLATDEIADKIADKTTARSPVPAPRPEPSTDSTGTDKS